MAQGPALHLTITNHPSGGPVFAGPQVQPWVCGRSHGDRPGLPRADRRAVQRADRLHVHVHGRGHAHVQGRTTRPRRRRPASIANTTTDQGATVPYIVRLERGAMDRGLYDVAVLANPSARVGAVGVAARLEPQGALPVRRRHGAVAHERRAAERPDRHGALARLPRREQQPQHPRQRRERRRLGGGADDAQGAHRRVVRPDPLHDRRRLLGRLDPAAPDRGELSRAARRHPAELQLPGQLDDGERGRTTATCCATTSPVDAELHARRSRPR